MILILGVIAVAVIVLMLNPSSRGSRVIKAKQKLEQVFKGPPASEVDFLLSESLLTAKNRIFVPNRNENQILFVFRPKASDMVSQYYLSELEDQYIVPGDDPVKAGILYAPDESSVGWTLVAKLRIACALQQKDISDLKSLKDELIMGFSRSAPGKIKGISPNPLVQLRAYWAKVPPEIQAQTTNILTANRAAAKRLGGSRRLLRSSTGVYYEERGVASRYELMYTFREAFPELNPPAAQ